MHGALRRSTIPRRRVMKRASAHLIGMTLIEQPLLRAPAPVVGSTTADTRLERRALLDLSIQQELQRGELRGRTLESALAETLTAVVEHELLRSEPLTPSTVPVLSVPRLFSKRRKAQRVDTLVAMNLARRDGRSVHATVAGIAAAGVYDAPRAVLRALRQAEIDAIGR